MNYVVIPAYEPDEKLVNLVSELKKYPKIRIIVVNDGSGKAYSKLFEQVGLYATVLTHRENLGKGVALKTAFKYIKKINKYGVVITADSDGQHTPEDIIKIAKECENKKNTIITGVRCFKGKVPIKSKLGNKITKYVFLLSTGIYLKDTQ